MSTDWRALCEEMADGLASTGEAASGTYKALLDRARAALAAEADGPAVPEGREPASVVGEPSDEDLLELTEDWPATTGPRHDLSGCPEVPLYSVFADELLEYARAVLARWGCHPAPVPPAERSEIARCLADSLKSFRLTQDPADYPADHWSRRAAELLQQQHLTPVPPAAGEVAELALKELERTVVLLMPVTGHKKVKRFDTIRAALKRLQELENKADLSPTPVPPAAVEVK